MLHVDILGAMLKSHFTYTCTTLLGNVKSAREETERLWTMPFLGQMTDDCRDFYDDMTSNSMTSFTHYALFVNRKQTTVGQLINPFYVFLYLCSDMYLLSNRDRQTGAFFGRRILRTMKSIMSLVGASALREFLHIFCHDNSRLHNYCLNLMPRYFSHVNDPEKSFFRSINRVSIDYARTNRKLDTYVCDHLLSVESALEIHSLTNKLATLPVNDRDEQLLIAAMNYSVRAGGKRLRPLITLMASDLYGLDVKRTLPLAQGIEYLHTSSLILDDMPAQDNSDLRRGQPTLHRATINDDIPSNLCEGRAQLAAVDLIAVSMSCVTENLIKNDFSSEQVIRVIKEISTAMHELCIGQLMDLRAARVGFEHDRNQLDALDRIAWFKTGKAIEISLVSVAILGMPLTTTGQQLSFELDRLRQLSRLIGIIFQMRDDLLDVVGENIGKPMTLDVKNNTVTYVSTLGIEQAQQRLQQLRQETLKLVDECWPKGAGTMKDVINFMVDRTN
jgi:geranylgeranyl pyrophosphate synthase